MAVCSMSENWRRPDSISFPYIWKKFETLSSTTGKVEKFYIQDIPEHMYEYIIELATVNYYNSEPIRLCTGFSRDRVSVAEEQELWRQALKQRLSFVCFAKIGSGIYELASISINCRCAENDPQREFQGITISNIALLTTHVMLQRSFYRHFRISEMAITIGSVTFAKYDLPILFNNMLECRSQISIASGIRMILSITTTETSYTRLSLRGFIPYTIMTYDELAKFDERFFIRGIQQHTPCISLMYKFLVS